MDRFSKNNIKFHKNPSSGCRVVPCVHTVGRTDGRTGGEGDRQIGTTKLNVTFRNFVNMPRNDTYLHITLNAD
jgi:hypothetical protein